jgi:AmiR/NasT family two-component response regulator
LTWLAPRYAATTAVADQLEQALSTRGMIEQAKGMIIAEQGCSADEAFQLLVNASQRSHMKLHDLATDLVERARERAAAGRPDQDRGSR